MLKKISPLIRLAEICYKNQARLKTFISPRPLPLDGLLLRHEIFNPSTSPKKFFSVYFPY